MRKPNGTPYKQPLYALETARIVATENEKREAERQMQAYRAAIELSLQAQDADSEERSDMVQRDANARRWLESVEADTD